MSYPNFNALNDKLTELFRDKQFADALALIQNEGANFPQDRAWVDYWHMCAAARVKEYDRVYQVAEQFLADGFWYGDLLWRDTPSFLPLQGNPDFERMVAAHRAAREVDSPVDQPVMILQLPENHSKASPLLIALHGNAVSVAHTRPFWQGAVSQGWVMALPQSNQVFFKGAYAWNDLDLAFANIQAHFDRLRQQTSFDQRRIVFGGHSLGGMVAIQMALEGMLDVCGFIAIGPVIPFQEEPERLETAIKQAKARGLRGYIVLGEDDEAISQDEARTFAEKLQAAGIACTVEIVPGVQHEYDPAYDAALLRGLAFVDPIRSEQP